jgi:DNA polymerase-1
MPRLINLEQSYGKTRPSDGQQLSMFSASQGNVAVPSKPARARLQPTDEALYTVVDNPEKLKDLVSQLNAAKQISFDTETTSTDQMRADLVGISLAVEPGHGFYIPVGHQAGSGVQLDRQMVLDALRQPLTNPQIPKVGHNLKYDFVVLARYGLRVQPLAFDTMIAEFLSNPASRNLSLKNLAWVRQDIRMTHIEDLIGKGKNLITMAQVPIEQAAAYAAADAQVVLGLMPELEEELKQKQALPLMIDLEMPLVAVLADMEMDGISVDVGFLQKMSAELSDRLQQIEQQVYQEVGSHFNLNSPQQLSEALFTRLKIEPPDRTQKTATGFYSTAVDVLEALSGKHAVVDLVLEYRELSKLRSTYLEALPGQVNPITGRVHTSYNQTGAVTGRIASSDPNLQNIPIRTELGRKVRNAFVAESGKCLLSVDYSQIELRIVAHMAQDQAMIEAFRAGQDIHATTAAAIYGVPLQSVDKDQRRRAKGINFGLIYGMSAFGLTRYTDLTLGEAEDFMQAYFTKFPGVKRYLDGIRTLAAQQGFVETLLGRRRYFPGLSEQSNRNVRMREEREAINAPIQGTAADIMKLAMLKVPLELKEAGLAARMILQVHDELVMECPLDEMKRTADVVQRTMEEVYSLDVPLSTEARWGTNWGQMTTL